MNIFARPMNSSLEEPIVALATAQGQAAIALIRVSGKDCHTLIENIFRQKNGKPLSSIKRNRMYYGDLIHTQSNTMVDEVMLCAYQAPYSYTGQDMLEISCHGSLFIQQQIIQLLISLGVRHAQPGEFTMRAYLNGKMDLSRAEAVADLIASENESQHKVALHHLKGDYASEILKLKDKLIEFASLIELENDFSEEDVEFADRTQLVKVLSESKMHLNTLLQSFATGQAIKEGIPVVIAGKPNAGKSTLLNALFGDERAIVSSIAGTTRDTIEEKIHLKGIQFRFIDTAGLRETNDEVEMIGVKRALQKIDEAAVLLYLIDVLGNDVEAIHQEMDEVRERLGKMDEIIFVLNKSDKANEKLLAHFENKTGVLCISAKEQWKTDELLEMIFDKNGLSAVNYNQSIVINARHYDALEKASNALKHVLHSIEQKKSNDLIALDLRHALMHVGEISGGITHEDVLSSIFSRFCIGK